MVAGACRRIEAAEGAVKLAVLAAEAGVSAFHFHRVFKAVTGVTPKGFFEAVRAKRVRSALTGARRVTAAVYEAGYESSGRFYAGAGAALGMAPSAYAKGGVGERVFVAAAACSLGVVFLARTEKGICAIDLGDDAAVLEAEFLRRFPAAVVEPAADAGILARVVEMVEGKADAGLPLDIRGTVFQRRVWAALRNIPAGRTVSYAELAVLVGVSGGARAVAGACAANKLAVAVPCHRVVRGDGDLAGYRWGVARKRALLERERE
jgi:AraC family transcriptional regulator of adaptative response/methylated-DNA-[protein]-cysteine methyltransferase